jgi:hypothetical protein
MNFIAPKNPIPRLTDAEVAEIRGRKDAVRASLACEGMYLDAEDEALLEDLLQERVTPEEGERRIVEWFHARQSRKVPAAS